MAQPHIKLLFPAGQLMVHLEKGPRDAECGHPLGLLFCVRCPFRNLEHFLMLRTWDARRGDSGKAG